MVEREIFGYFDGECMVTEDTEPLFYEVPGNYASKSKLVYGDKLKLTITEEGRLLYKQVGPIKRENRAAKMIENEYGFLVADLITDVADGVATRRNQFAIIETSITYYKLQPGDLVSVVLPINWHENAKVTYAAIDNIIPE